MKRQRIEELIGELAAGLPARVEGLVLEVRGGELIAVVPAHTADADVIHSASVVRGTVRLENERVMTFEIHADEAQNRFREVDPHLHEPAGGRRPRQPVGLDALQADHQPLTAAELMTRQVLTASPDELVEDIAKRMAFHNISGMPVEDWDGTVVGVVSEADVIGKQGVTIADVMSTDLAGARPGATVEELAALMAERQIRRVPILEGDRLVGLVTRGDLVRALALTFQG